MEIVQQCLGYKWLDFDAQDIALQILFSKCSCKMYIFQDLRFSKLFLMFLTHSVLAHFLTGNIVNIIYVYSVYIQRKCAKTYNHTYIFIDPLRFLIAQPMKNLRDSLMPTSPSTTWEHLSSRKIRAVCLPVSLTSTTSGQGRWRRSKCWPGSARTRPPWASPSAPPTASSRRTYCSTDSTTWSATSAVSWECFWESHSSASTKTWPGGLKRPFKGRPWHNNAKIYV